MTAWRGWRRTPTARRRSGRSPTTSAATPRSGRAACATPVAKHFELGHQIGLRIVIARQRHFLNIHRVAISFPTFQVVVALIDGNPKQPGAKLRILAKTPDVDKGLEKGLLGQILSLLRIGYHAARQTVDLPLVLLHQFFEGREISFLGPGNELRISHGIGSPAFTYLDQESSKMLKA